MGQPGHQSDDRPSRIFSRLTLNDIAANQNKKGIAIADDARKRKAEEEIRSVALGEG